MGNWAIGPGPYANCSECGQGRSARTLDANGVCAWCKLTVILTKPNPYIPLEPL